MAANAGNKIRNAKLVLLGDVGTGKSSLVLRSNVVTEDMSKLFVAKCKE